MSKRWLLGAVVAALPCATMAQDFPSRPVSMVVAAAAGGPIDVFTRIMAERMSPILGQRVVVENVGGGGGTLGGQRVAHAAPDGYTTLLGTIATHANPQLYGDKPLYDPLSDFVNVALIAEIPLVVIVRKEFQANTFQEFMAYAKANQGKLNYGSAGVGSASHLGCVMLDQAMGTNAQHVPYRGTGPAMQDLIGGRLVRASGPARCSIGKIDRENLAKDIEAADCRAQPLASAVHGVGDFSGVLPSPRMLRVNRGEVMSHAGCAALDRAPGYASVHRARDNAVIASQEKIVRVRKFHIPQTLATALRLNFLPGNAAIGGPQDVAILPDRHSEVPIEEARAVGPAIRGNQRLGPIRATISRVIKRIPTDDPTLQRIEKLDHLKIEAVNGCFMRPMLSAIRGMKNLSVKINRPAVEQVGEINRTHGRTTSGADPSPMQTAIDCVVGGGSVAAGPTVLRIEKKQIVNRAVLVVLDPRQSAIGGVGERVPRRPTVEWIDKRDRVDLVRH